MLEKILIADLQKVSGSTERKICAVGVTKILTECKFYFPSDIYHTFPLQQGCHVCRKCLELGESLEMSGLDLKNLSGKLVNFEFQTFSRCDNKNLGKKVAHGNQKFCEFNISEQSSDDFYFKILHFRLF